MAATWYTDETVIRTTKWPVSLTDVTAVMMTNFTKLAYDTINARLARRYTVPFSPVPAVIVEVSDLLTIYYGKLYSSGHASVDSGILKLMRDEAMERLAGLASGKERIPGVAPRRTRLWASWDKGHHRIMDRLPVEDLRQDDAEVEALLEEREDD